MKDNIVRTKSTGEAHSPCAGCLEPEQTRRDFFVTASCALIAAPAASGVNVESASELQFEMTRAVSEQGTECSYSVPTRDGVIMDPDNLVILVRQANRIYALSPACPHQNTALRWRLQDQRFQCPRHEARYLPDGTFTSGRATHNMDRFAIRIEMPSVVADLARLYHSDQQRAEWEAAVAVL